MTGRTRREVALDRSLQQRVAQAKVDAASTAATVQVAIDEAVSGDLIDRSPLLAAKIQDIEERLQRIEP